MRCLNVANMRRYRMSTLNFSGSENSKSFKLSVRRSCRRRRAAIASFARRRPESATKTRRPSGRKST